jgi:hypothetical protein
VTPSLNVGFDALPWENTIHMIAQFHRWIGLYSDHYRMVQSVEDVHLVRRSGHLGICFDIEGGNSLNADAGLSHFLATETVEIIDAE